MNVIIATEAMWQLSWLSEGGLHCSFPGTSCVLGLLQAITLPLQGSLADGRSEEGSFAASMAARLAGLVRAGSPRATMDPLGAWIGDSEITSTVLNVRNVTQIRTSTGSNFWEFSGML